MSALTPEQIVATLRAQVVIHELTGNAGMQRVVTVGAAADTIEAQRAEIDRLRGELDWIGNHMVMSMALNKSDLIRAMKSRARAALEGKP